MEVLSVRGQQIGKLLIEGCDNVAIGKELGIATRTVKSHMNRMFMQYGIKTGYKRVKLAVILYRIERAEELEQKEAAQCNI